MTRFPLSWLLAFGILAPGLQAEPAESSPVTQRRAMFRVRQDVRSAERAMARMELLSWQRESIQLLLDEQTRAADLFRVGSNLQGAEFEAKIQELIEVTRYKIALALPPELQAEWSKLTARRGLTFASKKVLALGTPETPNEY